jgi:hypothetical protein
MWADFNKLCVYNNKSKLVLGEWDFNRAATSGGITRVKKKEQL